MRFALLASAFMLSACNITASGETVSGDGPSAQKSFSVGAFDAVALEGSSDVIVTVGGAPSVRAEGPAAVLEKLDIRVEEGSLKIGYKRGTNIIGSGRTPVIVHVTAPALKAAAIGGSGDMRIDRVENRDFAASIAGSGDMNVGAMQVEAASFSIAGSGAMIAAGTAGSSKVSIAGSGDVNLDRLQSRTASVSIVGAGDVQLRAAEAADISIMGSGDVVVGGGAKCTVSKTGAGDVRCGA